jgi:CRISPR system Cascade subunit CasC
MLIEIHMLQNHSPSNLNRDEIGAPKTCFFGGTARARISSQCLKRSIRLSEIFRKALEGNLGQRTVAFPELVQARLPAAKEIPEEERASIVAACTNIAQSEENEAENAKQEAEARGDDTDGKPRTAQLIFLGPQEADEFVSRLARLRAEMKDAYDRFLTIYGKRKKAKDPGTKFWEILRESYQHDGVDIALFGRMTTSPAFENVEAAMEVAHAISTTEFAPEVDYFTAVDDIPGRQGAAYLEDAQFGSATFYKYFSLDWQALLRNLGGDLDLARNVVRAFVLAAAQTVPSGKRNSFGNNNLPDGILIEVKSQNVPTNYANAFLAPARASSDHAGEHDVMADSIRKLNHYVASVVKGYNIQSQRFWFAPAQDSHFDCAARVESLDDLVSATLRAAESVVAGEPGHDKP